MTPYHYIDRGVLPSSVFVEDFGRGDLEARVTWLRTVIETAQQLMAVPRVTVPNPQHSRVFGGWQTPAHIWNIARGLFGPRYLDPCTTSRNPTEAYYLFTEVTNGLIGPDGNPRDWASAGYGDALGVFCNPPGGLVKEFWERSVAAARAGLPVLWVGFNLNQLAYLTPSPLPDATFAAKTDVRISTYILRRRVHYIRDGHPSRSPTHHSYLSLLGGTDEQHEKFWTCVPLLPENR